MPAAMPRPDGFPSRMSASDRRLVEEQTQRLGPELLAAFGFGGLAKVCAWALDESFLVAGMIVAPARYRATFYGVYRLIRGVIPVLPGSLGRELTDDLVALIPPVMFAVIFLVLREVRRKQLTRTVS